MTRPDFLLMTYTECIQDTAKQKAGKREFWTKIFLLLADIKKLFLNCLEQEFMTNFKTKAECTGFKEFPAQKNKAEFTPPPQLLLFY